MVRIRNEGMKRVVMGVPALFREPALLARLTEKKRYSSFGSQTALQIFLVNKIIY